MYKCTNVATFLHCHASTSNYTHKANKMQKSDSFFADDFYQYLIKCQ